MFARAYDREVFAVALATQHYCHLLHLHLHFQDEALGPLEPAIRRAGEGTGEDTGDAMDGAVSSIGGCNLLNWPTSSQVNVPVGDEQKGPACFF